MRDGKKKRGDGHQRKQGPRHERLKHPYQNNLQKASHVTNQRQYLLRQPRKRNRTQTPLRMNTAGWRGPWAAPPSSRETTRGTLIPRGWMSPPPRARRQGAEISKFNWKKQAGTPEGWVWLLARFFTPTHQQGQTWQTQRDQHKYHTWSQDTRSHRADDGPKTHKSGLGGGGARRRPDPITPPPFPN